MIRSLKNLTEHVGENATVTVVFTFDGGIDTSHERNAVNAAIGAMNDEGDGLAWFHGIGHAFEIKRLSSV